MIAGKTESQINAAKRAQAKRLGQSGAAGKSKRCKKGKSCGASCIYSQKVCLVDIPWAASQGLTKTANKIQEKKKEKVQKISTKLSKLETSADFKDRIADTERMKDIPAMVKGSHEVAKLLDFHQDGLPSGTPLYSSPEEKAKYAALRLKIGKGVISNGVSAIDAYTSTYTNSWLIRLAEKDPKNSKLSLNDRLRAKQIGELLTLKEMPRPEVEKYRGFRASPERLQEMIAGARNKEGFNHNTTYSWSSSLTMGKDFADREIIQAQDRTERVIFRTINKRGVPIDYISAVDGESELLTPKNTNYRYSGYREINVNGKTYHVFDVEESA